MGRRAALIAAALVLGLASPALAHKMKTFVTVEGKNLVGIVYFSPGGRAVTVPVTVTAPDGTVLGRTVTDPSGNFRLPATPGQDNVVTADGGDGHVASFTVSTSDLGGQSAPAAEQKAPDKSSLPAVEEQPNVEQAVARQIRPLREELNAFQERVWMHDVLGGLGVIAGIGGVIFGLSASRRADRLRIGAGGKSGEIS